MTNDNGEKRMRARCLLVTGPGKGKTTAALGMAVRSLAAGKKVLLVRFCKAAYSGEVSFFSNIDGILVLSGTCGMTPPPEHPDFPKHRAEARKLFKETMRDAASFDTIILDELCTVTARGMIDEEEVTEWLGTLGMGQTVVLTGRGAGAKLLAAADTASEVLCLKHAYQTGIEAQEGIEF